MYGTLPKLQLHLTHHNYDNSGKISFLPCYHIDMVCVCRGESSGAFQRCVSASIIFGSVYCVSASATFYIDSW